MTPPRLPSPLRTTTKRQMQLVSHHRWRQRTTPSNLRSAAPTQRRAQTGGGGLLIKHDGYQVREPCVPALSLGHVS
jgi:hypothetical protein